MKKIQLLNWIFIAFIALQFTACDNEPLEGEFPQEGDSSVIDEGAFIADVGNFSFTADTASGILSLNNTLTITGTITETGERIELVVENPHVGTLNLVAGLGTDNSASYFETAESSNPYISSAIYGAVGELVITEYDIQNFKITGSFNFTGIRVALDTEGNPIIDGQGNPTLETDEITHGAFNKINYTTEDQGGGGVPISDTFFAKVDGVDFIPDAITTTLSDVFGVPVVKIVAVNETGQVMRLDIPEDLGVGTFAMESLSDGTKLIGVYNPATGGENLTSNPGTITITKFNTLSGIIEAIFSFTATDPIGADSTVAEITEGDFAVDYISSPGDLISNFTAEVDGILLNPDSINIGESIFNGVSRFNITVINSDTGERMGIFFPRDIEVGTYDLTTSLIDGSEKFGQYTPEFGVSPTFISNPGTLTILNYDTEAGTIEGTFSFTGTDQLNQDPTVYEITNGEFSLEF